MTTWRCQINGSNDTHHPTRIKNYWYLRFQIELPTWVSQPLGDTLTNETGFGVTLSALQWMIKKKDGCKWCIKMYQRSPSFQMSWAGWRFKKLVILHAYASFVKILIQMFNIVPILPQHTPPLPPLCRFTQLKAQSSKPYKSKSLPNHSPEASEQLHGPHICLDVDLQAPYARMGGLRRPGFQALQNQGTVQVCRCLAVSLELDYQYVSCWQILTSWWILQDNTICQDHARTKTYYL